MKLRFFQLSLVFALVASLFVGCKESGSGAESGEDSEENTGFVIKGAIQNHQGAMGPVYLNHLVGQNLLRFDTVQMAEDGSFEFRGEVPSKDFYQISLSDGKFMVFVLGNEKLEFQGDYLKWDASKKIIGSRDTDVFNKMTAEINVRNTNRNLFNQMYQKASDSGNQGEMQNVKNQYEASEAKSIAKIKKIIANNTDSFIAALGTLNFMDANKDLQFMDSVSNIMNETLPDHPYTKQLFTQVSSLKVLAVGAVAPDIQLPGPDGISNSLSSYRGKYVLIDFWASWCRPCRKENPNVVRMYNEYKNQNFEIFGVSLDKDGGKWAKAIEQDGITWPQVSDLKGWTSSAAALYQVKSIPATFLIDPEGKIVAKNLRGAALEEKMKEIFG